MALVEAAKTEKKAKSLTTTTRRRRRAVILVAGTEGLKGVLSLRR
jgi:hypothetical protein